jgi:hypothetical protein
VGAVEAPTTIQTERAVKAGDAVRPRNIRHPLARSPG